MPQTRHDVGNGGEHVTQVTWPPPTFQPTFSACGAETVHADSPTNAALGSADGHQPRRVSLVLLQVRDELIAHPRLTNPAAVHATSATAIVLLAP
jgi:hypothetical protein